MYTNLFKIRIQMLLLFQSLSIIPFERFKCINLFQIRIQLIMFQSFRSGATALELQVMSDRRKTTFKSLKLKQAPPSPPALIQQHLIAGEPQFQSCAQMDKPSRVGYGLHRRNTQPAKSARYWSASTCFTRWTLISTWQTSPISSCAATRADLSPGRPQPEPRSKSQRAPWRSHAFFGIACSPPRTS